MKENNPYINCMLTNAAATTLSGLAMGATAGTPFGIPGAAIGAALGSASSLLALNKFQKSSIAKRIIEQKIVKKLLIEKFLIDTDRSINELNNYDFRKKRAFIEIMSSAGLTSRKDLRFKQDFDLPILGQSLSLKEIKHEINKIAGINNILISTASINVGVCAALKSLQSRVFEANNISLEVDYYYTNGLLHFTSICKNTRDFIVTPIDPFFLSESKTATNYRFLMPICTQKQYLFRKKSKRPIRNSKTYIYANSSAELHATLEQGIPRNTEYELFDDRNLFDVYQVDLAGGDYIIVWEPLSHKFRADKTYEIVPGSEYEVLIGLFCNKSWCNSKKKRKLIKVFTKLFQNEFRYINMNRNRNRSLENLLVDDDYMNWFASGSGLVWTNGIVSKI